MPWIEKVSDVDTLRRCVRDLIALSSLPAMWQAYNPLQIANSLAEALTSIIDPDVVYVCFSGTVDEPGAEVTRTKPDADPVTISHAEFFKQHLHELRAGRAIADASGKGTVHIATAPIGVAGEAFVLVGSHEPGFPTEVQRLLLGVGANDATIALERWKLETAQRRFVALIESSSDFIGVASLAGVPQYVNPAGLKLVGLSGMADASRLHILDYISHDDRARACDEIWPLVMREGRWVGEINLRNFKKANVIPCLVDWFRVDDPRSGAPMNIATVSRDLSAQKRAEAQLRMLNESLEQREALDAATRVDALSPREREVLLGLLAGQPTKAIAFDLGLSVRTVEAHRARMRKRLGVRQLSEAIRLAVIAKLRQPDFPKLADFSERLLRSGAKPRRGK